MSRRTRNWAGLGFIIFALWLVGSVLPKSPSASVGQKSGVFLDNQPQSASKQSAPAPAPLPTVTPDPVMLQRESAGNLPYTKAYYYAPETSHSVANFADVFNQYGAVHGMGLPLTEAFIESRPDGKAYWVQYFEKAVVEYHPELAGSNAYLLTTLGVDSLHQNYPGALPNAKQLPGKGSQTFPETNHTVRGAFLTRWNAGGGLARFGYPLTESFEEVSPADGKTYMVQYFERAEMQYHPKEKAPQDVQLVALGAARLAQLYPNGAPYNASQAVPSPTVDAAATETAHNVSVQQTQVAEDNIAAARSAAHAHATQTALARQIPPETAPGPFIPYPGNGGGPTPCKDGTWSHSSGRGTCSHHGGIKR